MRAVNILWDVDDVSDLEVLPKVIEIPDAITEDGDISDYISNVTGYCHKGFDLI